MIKTINKLLLLPFFRLKNVRHFKDSLFLRSIFDIDKLVIEEIMTFNEIFKKVAMILALRIFPLEIKSWLVFVQKLYLHLRGFCSLKNYFNALNVKIV